MGLRRVLGAEVAPMARRSLLVDFITVYGLGGKAIVFTETKREADEVAAALANTHPCEARRPCHWLGSRRQGSWFANTHPCEARSPW